jgi:NitT/TauT family transport system ATP-binding protein
MSEPGIRLHDVSKNYDATGQSVPALAATSLEVRQGEMLVLIGPSGCGKTTMLRMIGGLIPPSAGRIEVAGHPLWTSSGRNQDAVRKLGIVFQDPNLFPWLTIEDNVALPLEIQGVPRAARIARARTAGAGRHRRLREPASARTLRRHAPARGDRAGAGRQSGNSAAR